MKKETFDKIIESIKKIDEFNDQLCEAGLEFYNTECYDAICSIQNIMFEQEYGKEGRETIDWFLYELPEFRKKYPEDKDVLWDEENNPIPMETLDNLYDFLEKSRWNK